MSSASGWLVNLVNRGPGLAPEEPEAPPPRARSVVRSAERGAEPRQSPPPEPRVSPSAEPAQIAEFGIPPIRSIRPPAPPTRKPLQKSLPLAEGAWQFPPMSLLKERAGARHQRPQRGGAAGQCEAAGDCAVRLWRQGEIVEIRPGPVVTLYELVPAPGIRSARVIGLADDVARSLSVTAVRIATVPGRNVIGIEVPNSQARDGLPERDPGQRGAATAAGPAVRWHWARISAASR